MAVQNFQTGAFVNAQENYFAAPQQLNAQGQIIGHSHVVVEQLTALDQTTPTDPKKFAFFKGLNAAAQGGVLTADVTAGLPAGFYKVSSINTAANHQPVLVPIAQHGSLDDVSYVSFCGLWCRMYILIYRIQFTITDDGKPAASAATAAASGAAGAGAAAAKGTTAAANTKDALTATKGAGVSQAAAVKGATAAKGAAAANGAASSSAAAANTAATGKGAAAAANAKDAVAATTAKGAIAGQASAGKGAATANGAAAAKGVAPKTPAAGSEGKVSDANSRAQPQLTW